MTALACVATVTGFLSSAGWLFELTSHFRLQYAWVLVSGVIALGIAHQWLFATLAAGCAFINIRLILPLYRRRPAYRDGRRLRVLLANVWKKNHAHERTCQFIRELQPDVVLLAEVDERWLQALHACTRAYPFTKSVLLPGGYGLVLLSRLPFSQAQIVQIGQSGPPSLLVRVPLEERELTIIGTHPLSPIRPSRTRIRNEHLMALGKLVKSHPGPLMVLGDLNTTSWSFAFQHLLNGSRLRDSRVGFGLQPSWPASNPFVRIPLDHCLLSPDISVATRQVGPPIGSDHLPVIVDIVIAPSVSGPSS